MPSQQQHRQPVPFDELRPAVNGEHRPRVALPEHEANQPDRSHHFQQIEQNGARLRHLVLESKKVNREFSAGRMETIYSVLLLERHVPRNRLGEIEIAVLLDRPEDEAGEKAAQVIHYVVRGLFVERQNRASRHHIFLPFSQHLLEQPLFQKAPHERLQVVVEERALERALIRIEIETQMGSHSLHWVSK